VAGLRAHIVSLVTSRRRRSARLSRRTLHIERLEGRIALSADPVLFWNDVAMQAALNDSRAAAAEQGGPTRTSRAMGIVHVAMYDAYNAVRQEYEPYYVQAVAPRGSSYETAVGVAAHDTLAALYPNQEPALDRILTQFLAGLPHGLAEYRGFAYGQQVAQQILDARSHDGWDSSSTYRPSMGLGHHAEDPMTPGRGFLTPSWGKVQPFAISSVDAMPSRPFPALGSREYVAEFEEVRVKGALDAEVSDRDHNGRPDRTDYDTETGIFWGYDHRLGTPIRIYNQAVRTIGAQQHNTVGENARLLALVHMAMADAGIVAWNTKYQEDIWRPVMAIRTADGDPRTVNEPNWRPLGAPGNNGDPLGFPGARGPNADPDPRGGPDFTPPFPAYTSGHSTFGAATFRTLSRFYGKDAIQFTLTSEDSGTRRTYPSLSQAMIENAESRIWLGVHWRADAAMGIAQGKAIADYVFGHELRPRTFGRGADLSAIAADVARQATGGASSAKDDLSLLALAAYQEQLRREALLASGEGAKPVGVKL
jgi:hypothetical protein